MKKLLFTAMACVAFAFNGLASNEVVENTNDKIEETKKPCKIAVKLKGADGEIYVRYASGAGNITLSDCDNVRVRFEKDLKEEGYEFNSDEDVTLIWGPVE